MHDWLPYHETPWVKSKDKLTDGHERHFCFVLVNCSQTSWCVSKNSFWLVNYLFEWSYSIEYDTMRETLSLSCFVGNVKCACHALSQGPITWKYVISYHLEREIFMIARPCSLFGVQFPIWDRNRRWKASKKCLSWRYCGIWRCTNRHSFHAIWSRRDVCLPPSSK